MIGKGKILFNRKRRGESDGLVEYANARFSRSVRICCATIFPFILLPDRARASACVFLLVLTGISGAYHPEHEH